MTASHKKTTKQLIKDHFEIPGGVSQHSRNNISSHGVGKTVSYSLHNAQDLLINRNPNGNN